MTDIGRSSNNHTLIDASNCSASVLVISVSLRLLLDAGASKDLANNDGQLPMDLVCDHENADQANAAAIRELLQ